MHEGYKKYLDFLKSKGMVSPMPEKEWKVAVGIVEKRNTRLFYPAKIQPKKDRANTTKSYQTVTGSTDQNQHCGQAKKA